jgi:hypothetical protein
MTGAAHNIRGSMVNIYVLVWLLTGGMLGLLIAVQSHFSGAALLASSIFAAAMVTILSAIQRQPVR